MTQKINSKQEAQKTFELALGRILSMGARLSRNGDIEMYEKCKWLIVDAAEYLGKQTHFEDTTSYASNYYKINS